ncbi:hypothetical protein AB3K78_15445 [Leucobacter sp. HNU]|uniref:hypothetical protein n=1 Tax=Leucobacter sp. HNU TaxID=3236805 RepID=UPI003A8125CC
MTIRHFAKPRAYRELWRRNGDEVPAIRIQAANCFIIIDYQHARALVDRIHDLCDEHERQLREAPPTP